MPGFELRQTGYRIKAFKHYTMLQFQRQKLNDIYEVELLKQTMHN